MSNDDVLAAQIKSSIITKIKTQEYLQPTSRKGNFCPQTRTKSSCFRSTK